MRFPWLLSIVVGVGSSLVVQSDRLVTPLPQTPHSMFTREFVPELNPPPLMTQGAGTR